MGKDVGPSEHSNNPHFAEVFRLVRVRDLVR